MSDVPSTRRGRRLASARRFLRTEAGGAVALLVAAVVALAWANSPLQGGYERLWHDELTIGLGDFSVTEDLRHWINEGLMALFFLVVGLEIKRELVTGDLNDPRAAALPAIAAAGGMLVPALLYAAINLGQPGSSGWAIPMATDIAFAVGILALLGSRVPASLKLFLLTLAIVDDLGAIVVIALFYAGNLDLGALGAAVLGAGAIVALRAARVVWLPAYLVIGLAMWVATHASGVHATIAGAALGLLAPVGSDDDEASAGPALGEWLEGLLHPWTSMVIVPLFALANAGVTVRADSLGSPGARLIVVGVMVGLVAGKALGIAGASWLVVRAGIARLPEDVTWPALIGMSLIAGIGFTVSLFVAGLAFATAGPSEEAAKVGILLASALAAALGALVLVRSK